MGNGAVIVVAPRHLDLTVPVIVTDDVQKTMAIIAKKYYFPKEKSFKLIGVTGTNGKTTVSHMICDILKNSGKKVGIIGTNGIFIRGERKKIEQSTPTTPGALELWQIFGVMEEAVEYVVMEVSSHALSLKRVWGCEFDVAVFTNLTRDHLDFHENMEEYKKAKEKLFKICKKAVINIDDITGTGFYSNVGVPKLSVGLNDADLSVHALSLNDEGSAFKIEYENQFCNVKLKLPGKFNVYNALLSAGACISLGFDFEEVIDGLNNSRPVKGRMEKIPTDKGFSIIIDYAHTPDGLEKLIHTAKGFSKGRVITLFGCGGDRDKTKRPLMGEISGRFSDYTIITSDNPRTENPISIIEDIFSGIRKTDGKYTVIPDRRLAIEHAISIARKNDVILLAGKGQEDYQIIGEEKIHFDEREIVEKILQKKE